MSSGTAVEAALRHVMELADERRATRQRDGVLLPSPTRLGEAQALLSKLEGDLSKGPRASRKEQAEEAWIRWEAGGGELLAFHVRTLSWDPEYVSKPEFKVQLAKHGVSRRALRALIPTYNRLWRPDSDQEPELGSMLATALDACEEPRGITRAWQANPDALFGPQAANALAQSVFKVRGTVSRRLQELELARDTEFAKAAAAQLLAIGADHADDKEVLGWLFDTAIVSDSEVCGPAGWSPVLAGLILHPKVRGNEQTRERVLELAMRDLGLGDPRIEPARWTLLGSEATDEVIRWISSEDLRFFFSLVMHGQRDHQGRHDFWQQYVDGVSRSLVVLCDRDIVRLKRPLRDLEERGRRFARMTGNSSTSAFVMEFGDTTLVEFSQANNSCYVYPPGGKKFPVRWSDRSVAFSALKQRGLPDEHRMPHLVSPPWQRTFRGALARWGIRPVEQRR